MLNKIKKTMLAIIESLIRNISGYIGIKLRYFYYKNRFKNCGNNVRIDEGVIFRNPENISIGDDVWINSYSIFTARPLDNVIKNRILVKKTNYNFFANIGEIVIGNNSGIGSFSTIQGFGGIVIENNVTLSDYVKLFSFSHLPYDPKDKSKITLSSSVNKGSEIACIESPLVIKTGSWLGLNCTMFKGTIGKNCFIATNSAILDDIEQNSYASGSPAKKIKDRFENYEEK